MKMKSFEQFCTEADFNLAKEIRDREINLVHSFGRPGHQAPGYSYAGKRAPDRNNPSKEVPSQVRHVQDLKAAQVRSRQRQYLHLLNGFDLINNKK
tara:strand:- start:726 stop:1013 length:288 start_codon:yes stop_codon:yes gene_type:complete